MGLGVYGRYSLVLSDPPYKVQNIKQERPRDSWQHLRALNRVVMGEFELLQGGHRLNSRPKACPQDARHLDGGNKAVSDLQALP